MSATFIKGDLFGRELPALAHGCNCAGAMAKGIAVEFRHRFPKMYKEYQKRCKYGLFNIGDVFAWTEQNVTVFNLGTQRTWRQGAELDAVERALRAMVKLAEEKQIRCIGMPRIGAGLGGLSWNEVRQVIQRIGESTSVELLVFEDYSAQ